jgi:nucleoside-diphosphate-sugar epimerase
VKILVAGAAGFIGSNLTNHLLAEGNEVIAVDNLITGKRKNLDKFIGDPNFKFVEHDVILPLELESEIDWILHFASPASPPQYLKYPIETLRVNSEGTYHLLELARKNKAKFFFASTSEVYGNPLIHPQSEKYWGHVNPNGPRSVYDEAKRFSEAMVAAYHRENKLSIRITRIFNTYGPLMDPEDGRVVSNFICAGLKGRPLKVNGDGQQTRSFQFVDDLIEGIIKLMKVEYHEPINLGNPVEFKILDFAHLIKKMTGDRSEIIFEELPQDDPKQRKPDISLAKRILDWEPKITIAEGLKRTISYFQKF